MDNVSLEIRDKISTTLVARHEEIRLIAGIEKSQRKCAKCCIIKDCVEFTQTGWTRIGPRFYRYCKPCAGDVSWAEKLRNVFNITVEEHDRILTFQNGMCAICGKRPTEEQNRLSLDHRHKDGLLRGLLCWLCNRMVGMMRDDPERARKVLAYLANPPATQALGEERFCIIGRVTKKRKNRDPFLVKRRAKEGKSTHGDAISLGKFLKTVAWG